jgi:hypothetical protein
MEKQQKKERGFGFMEKSENNAKSKQIISEMHELLKEAYSAMNSMTYKISDLSYVNQLHFEDNNRQLKESMEAILLWSRK